jgi:hypothetical protein
MTAYEKALVDLAGACVAVECAAIRLKSSMSMDEKTADPRPAIRACRMAMLGALRAMPGLSDVFVVPALTEEI